MESRLAVSSALREFLHRHGEEAFLVLELAAQLRARGVAEGLSDEEVRAALATLREQGAVCMSHYHWADPHLPLSGFEIVSAVDPSLPEQQAQDAAYARIEAAWSRWLRAFLASHRCS